MGGRQSEVPSPAEVLDESDPGDDTGLRFRYQYCHAAIHALRVLTRPDEAAAVVCENHEDILVERPNGRFRGLQIKTRANHRRPLRSTDPEVRTALVRFCRLFAAFGEHFEGFDLVTNHRFWDEQEGPGSLPWLLSELQSRGGVTRLRRDNPVRKFAEELSSAAGTSLEATVTALLRTNLSARDEPVRIAFSELKDAIAEFDNLADQPYSVVSRIAAALVDLATQASTKRLGGAVSDLYAPGSDINAIRRAQTLAGKRITAIEVRQIVQMHLAGQVSVEPTHIEGLAPLGELPRGLDITIQKMSKGGLQYSRIQSTKDYVYSFQHLYMKWVGKYGEAMAREMSHTVLAQVNDDCAEAHAEVEACGELYGALMYERLREKLRARCSQQRGDLPNCSEYHLLGASGVLTQNCKAWWSTPFDVIV